MSLLKSACQKKPVFGIGINDADYIVNPVVNGKSSMCPYYNAWSHMMGRSYSKKVHSDNPTYVDCTVTPEWHSFMAFRAWMMTQDWKGKQLDKDILVPGNKVYSPETCIFITRQINTLFNNCGSRRGKYPQGVHFEKSRQKFQAYIAYFGKRKFLGRFNTASQASTVYLEAKSKHVKNIAEQQSDSRLSTALFNHAEILLKRSQI